MSKSKKINALKPHLIQAVNRLKLGNAAAYGGVAENGQKPHEVASPLKGLGAAILMKADQMKKGNLRNGVSHQDWIEMGKNVHKKIQSNEEASAVCDTCSSLVIYLARNIIQFSGRVELFAETTIHHHYIVVDRAKKSDVKDYKTWGSNAFVVDVWQAKFAVSKGRPEETKRGFLFKTVAHHWKHGIYRNPSEHVYTLNKDKKYKFKVDAEFLM